MKGLFPHGATRKVMRDHQVQFFHDCYAAARDGHKRIIGCASVGWGKTLLAANMFKSAYSKGNRSMFTVPRNALIEPSVEEFESEGLTDIGIVQQNHPRTNPMALLQVASIHTAVNRPMDHPPRLVIVDEVHLVTPEFQKILDSDAWKDTLVIGLSATPWKKGMGLKWTKLVKTKTCAQLIEEGYLVKPRYIVGVEEPDTTGRKVRLDDQGNRVMSENDEAAVMGDKRIVGDIVRTWLEHGENRPTFCYAVNLEEASKIRDAFAEAGVPCGYVDGAMGRDKQLEVLRAYREGVYKVVVNYGVLTVGIDEDVRCIVIGRIIKSESDWVQIIGRGLRKDNPAKRVKGMGPKVDLLVIDHGANLTRDEDPLPPAEDIYHDHLDTSDPENKKVKAFEQDAKPKTFKKCKRCGHLVQPGELKCGFCFAEVPKTVLSHVEGRFVEFDKNAKRERMSEAQAFYSGLLMIAQQRHWKDGWAAQAFREKFGHYPPRNLERIARTPRIAVQEFVAAKDRAYRQKLKARKATA